MSETVIQMRRDKRENWEANDPLLGRGEIALDTNYGRDIKFGDGSRPWSEITPIVKQQFNNLFLL